MTDTNNGSISMDDLFAALGHDNPASHFSGSDAPSTSSKKPSAATDDGNDALAELFDLVGDSAIAAKRAGSSSAQEPELDLFAALNIDTSSASGKSQEADHKEYAARLSERENQLREQQIRSQQWQRELKEREERLRRAEQARIEEAEARIRREQEAAAAHAAEARQAADAAVQEQQPAPEEQPPYPSTEPIADARHNQVAAVQMAAEQARLQAEAQERAAAAEREAMMRAQAEAAALQAQREAEARAAEQMAAEQARLQAEAQERAAAAEREAMMRAQAEAAAAAQAQREAEEAAKAKADAERRVAAEAELASQPTQVIKPLSETTANAVEAETFETAPIQQEEPSGEPADTAPLQQSSAHISDERAIPEPSASHESAESASSAQPMPSQDQTQTDAGAEEASAEQDAPEAWERKHEPVKRTEQEKREEARPEPTKRTSEPKQPPKPQPMPVMKAAPGDEQQPDIYGEEYAEPVAGSKLGNVIGIILIAIAVVCVVLTILLFTGAINKDTFAIDNSPTGQQMTADIESSNMDSNGQATYAYVVRGLNGETHEAIEVATFGEDGKLQKSSIEITVPSQEVADALLAQLSEEFGGNVESSSASADKVTLVVKVQDSDLDKNGYTELLASTMTNFKEIDQ